MAEKVYNWTDDPMVSGVADCNTDVVNDCLMHLKYENTTDAIQNMYETGQVETQTRGFNQLQQMRHSTFDLSKFTVVGSPTITDDGIASGFSNSSYLATTTLLLSGNFEIYGNFKLGSYFDNGLPFGLLGSSGLPVRFQLKNGGIGFYFYYNNTWINNTTFVWELNTEYSFKVSYINSKLNLYLSKVNQQLVKYTNDISDWEHYDVTGVRFGFVDHKAFNGSIDLKHFSITVDGKEVFSGNKTGLDVIKPDNYEVVGSPVISEDGIASGFSNVNYLATPQIDFANANSWILETSFITPNSFTTDNSIYSGDISYNGVRHTINATGKLSVAFASTTTNYDIGIITGLQLLPNTRYYSRVVFNNNTYRLFYSTDGLNYLETGTPISSSLKVMSAIGKIGVNNNNNTPFLNAIDLNSFKIYIDGNLVYQPCLKIPYTQSKTGSKIVDGVYRDRVIDLYEQEGQAGYYTIDEPNKNFTLPMGEIYGMIEQKGTYQPPLLSTMWSDHLLNDMSWLRADTFSWQNGTTYWLAYNELLAEYNDSASSEETEGSITFKRTPKGYKIALSNQETAILNKYNSDGIAWYYILDTTNKKFKLPRTKFGFEGLRTSVGDDIKAGLPNITGTWTGAEQFTVPQKGTGAITWINAGGGYSGGGGGAQGSGFNFDASLSNPIYGNSDTVQPPATQMYLYFYIGQYTPEAVEQTAGLNAELFNNKMDRDLSNRTSNIHFVTETYVNGTSWYRVWSDGWCEQGGIVSLTNNQTLTVNLLKSYTNSTYSILQSPLTTNYTDVWGYGTKIVSLTNSSFNIYINSSTSGKVCWQASGYKQ